MNLMKGPIAWMAKNPVAANIAMFILLAGGLLNVNRIQQEIFPKFSLDRINITVVYPGANPGEIEKGVVLAIEESVRGIEGIKRVNSTVTEGLGAIMLHLTLGANGDNVLSEVKTAIDGIQSFPDQIENPIVQLLASKEEVISLVLYGNTNEKDLRHYADLAKDELLKIPEITLAEIQNDKTKEISIEVPKANLKINNLSLKEIANIVTASTIEVPAGELQTLGGDLALRTNNKLYTGEEFGNIIIKTDPSGSNVKLSDIAKVHDGFEESNDRMTFNGLPAVSIQVFRTGDQGPVEIAEAVQVFKDKFELQLPANLNLAVWNDFSQLFSERVDLLKRNALIGLFLVFFILALFLELRLAFWVTMGIVASFVGAFLFMPALGISINMISLFAFIITLGIVVDDAIVVGENVFEERHRQAHRLHASIIGTKKIASPVTFAVLTTMVAFCPKLFVPGIMGKFFVVIPSVVILVLALSLVESLFILPCHLAHAAKIEDAKKTGPLSFFNRKQQIFSGWFDKLIDKYYPPVVNKALENRYVTLGAFLSSLIIALALVGSGRIPFSFMPDIDSDVMTISASYPVGTPISKTRKLQDKLVKSAEQSLIEMGGLDKSKGIMSQIGKSLIRSNTDMSMGASNSAQTDVLIYLVSSDQRNFTSKQFMERWRKNLGDLPGLKSISYRATLGPSAGPPIDVQIKHRNTKVSEKVAARLAQELETFEGLISIQDGVSEGKQQLEFKLNNEGRRLGFTATSLGQEVRSAFFGATASRQQRERSELKVVVRLPKSERESEYDIDNFLIKSPMGSLVPLSSISTSKHGLSYSQINREDGQRLLNVTADKAASIASTKEILENIQADLFPKLQAEYPGTSFTLAGEHRTQGESLGALGLGFLVALLVIYALLAIPFKSYLQPFIVMSAIPFGIVCAIAGHVIMGYGLSLISMMGIVALAGIVVNDSLVLVHAANEERENRHEQAPKSATNYQAIVAFAGRRRFRPILLTSVTTFLGLAPMIFETSMQARFLIPMAISVGFGVLFSTFITLILVPALYVIVEDIKGN